MGSYPVQSGCLQVYIGQTFIIDDTTDNLFLIPALECLITFKMYYTFQAVHDHL